jgi:iron-sulfur cluster assembly accessory protein
MSPHVSLPLKASAKPFILKTKQPLVYGPVSPGNQPAAGNAKICYNGPVKLACTYFQGGMSMVSLTPVAITKVKEILTQQTPSPTGLRVAVVGGGCSGFSYHMAFENQVNESSDNVYEFDGLKVMVDQMSEMYLDGVQIDYIESIEGSGFKFNNPNVKSTCGCGSSFSV